MPGLDKTGPAGQGSQTGRRMGNCAQDPTAQSDGPRMGRGRGLGRKLRNSMNDDNTMPGRGNGRGNRGQNKRF